MRGPAVAAYGEDIHFALEMGEPQGLVGHSGSVTAPFISALGSCLGARRLCPHPEMDTSTVSQCSCGCAARKDQTMFRLIHSFFRYVLNVLNT